MNPPRETTYARDQARRGRWRVLAAATAVSLGAVFALEALLANEPGYPYMTVTGKHHTDATQQCDADGCVIVPARWQLDILSGRRATTIDVDESTYDRYAIGDAYRR